MLAQVRLWHGFSVFGFYPRLGTFHSKSQGLYLVPMSTRTHGWMSTFLFKKFPSSVADNFLLLQRLSNFLRTVQDDNDRVSSTAEIRHQTKKKIHLGECYVHIPCTGARCLYRVPEYITEGLDAFRLNTLHLARGQGNINFIMHTRYTIVLDYVQRIQQTVH